MDNQTRELVIIGAGPGGYAAAFHAADLGLSVTLIDREPNPGGVCLYRGCIPAKVLLHVAKIIREAQKAKDWGVDFGPPRIDTDRLREWKNKVVSRLTRGLGMLSKKRKVEYIQGTARFTGPRTIRVDAADGQTRELMFEQAILATGAHIAALPNLPMESERMMTSDDALEVHGVPQTLLVIGGGYIGMELANVYARLGSRVTVAEMMPRILTELDDDLLAVLRKSFDEYIETILVNTKVTQTEETAEGIRVWFDGDGKDLSGQTFEKVLVAVGRKPNTARIGLEHTGVQLDERGFVRVDDQRRTGDDRIFAIGDLTGNPQFAHKAMHEGRVAAHLIAGRPAAFDPEVIPFVEYTEIEAAG